MQIFKKNMKTNLVQYVLLFTVYDTSAKEEGDK